MSWNHDHLAPVETLLYRSDLIKVGTFVCDVAHPCFSVSEPLDNDVFVLPKRPVWIRRNEGEYRFVEPGAILMHRAGATLERRRAGGTGERTYWFGVHPDVFVDALQRHELSTEAMGGALIADPQLRYRPDTATRQRRLVDRARAYLDAHLTESTGLEKVAQDTGTSLYHLCRVFREQTGLTMHAYRTRQRLGYVLDRLVDGRAESLTELALDTGFASHSHLSRVFQKQMGVPPSTIRAMGQSPVFS